LVREGDVEKVKALLKDNPDLVFSQDSDGQTPLHLAAWNDQRDFAELLLVSKAEVKAKDKFGQTPLHYAASNDRMYVVELLRQYGGHE
jgi:ankyrin repeat protein